MKLSDFTSGRDNNFNLLRMFAAYSVLVTHSFAVVNGTSAAEPFQNSIGMTIGAIAVDVFFVTSGFLVTASLLRRQNTIEFIWARFLRIAPALFVMHILTLLCLGLFFTTLSWPLYFSDPKIYKYLAKCLTMISGNPYELPGVFESNPYKRSINNSLWTIPYEIVMYAILAFLWFVLCGIRKYRVRVLSFIVVFAASLSGFLLALIKLGLAEDVRFIRLFFMFFTGSSFFILRNAITVSKLVFLVSLILLILSGFNRGIFFFIYIVTLAYILFYIAYVPSGFIRKYNRLGDYSYGLYIYAFPVQQSTVALVPNISVFHVILISSMISLLFSIFSWHFIEKDALKLKGGGAIKC